METTAQKKKTKKKNWPRPDAVFQRPVEEKSYAEVLSNVRQKVKPENLNTEIRKTLLGDILLKLGSKTRGKEILRGTLR